MSQSRSERFSFRHALGLSTVLHGLIAPLFVVSSVAFVGVGQSAEPLGFRSGDVAAVTTMTIEHRAQHAVRAAGPPRTKMGARAAAARRRSAGGGERGAERGSKSDRHGAGRSRDARTEG